MLRSEVIKVKKVSELEELSSISGFSDALLMLSINKEDFKIGNYNIKLSNFINDIKEILNSDTSSQEEVCKAILEKSLNYLSITGDDYIKYVKKLNEDNDVPSITIDTTLKVANFDSETGGISDGVVTSKTLVKVLNENKWKII